MRRDRLGDIEFWWRSLKVGIVLCALFASLGAFGQDVEPPAEIDRIANIADRLKQREAAEAASKPLVPQDVPAPAEVELLPVSPQESLPLGLPAPTPSTAGDLQPLGDPGGSGARVVLNTVTALGVVIGLVLLARFGYRKLGGRVATRSSPVVEVLSRTMVAPRNHVLLLRVGQRILVVSDSSAGSRTLTEVTDPEEVAELLGAVQAAQPDSLSGSFGRVLGKMNDSLDPEASDLASEGGDDTEHKFDRVRDSLGSLTSRLKFANGKREGAL